MGNDRSRQLHKVIAEAFSPGLRAPHPAFLSNELRARRTAPGKSSYG